MRVWAIIAGDKFCVAQLLKKEPNPRLIAQSGSTVCHMNHYITNEGNGGDYSAARWRWNSDGGIRNEMLYNDFQPYKNYSTQTSLATSA